MPSCSNLCVPITMSTLPSASPCSTASCCLAERKRDRLSTLTGQSANRSWKFWKCCCASSVVGTSTATCLPLCTAMKAARIATSVIGGGGGAAGGGGGGGGGGG